MRFRKIVGFLLISVFSASTWAADILYLSTTASPSHQIWDKTLMLALRERGHKLTVLTHADEVNEANITYFRLEGVQEQMAITFEPNEIASQNSLQGIKDMFEWLYTCCQLDLETDGFETLHEKIRNGAKFDLIIMDITSGQCMYPLIQMLGSPPVIGTSPFGVKPHLTFSFGIDVYSSYIPFYAFAYTDRMTFLERANNYFHIMFFLFWHQYMYMPSQARLAQSFFGDDILPLEEVEKNFTLLLVNYDPILNYPHPLAPAIIPVGGLHTKREKSLSKELQTYLDNSKDGAILFSLGTNLRSDKLSIKQKKALLLTFAKLKENILWKYESKIENLPKNVLVRQWLPQNDIIAHPNIKLFVTHAGALSTQEAIYHGVPVVGIPFFADQIANIGRLVATNMGKELSINNLTQENIYETIREVIDNPSYKNNATIRSRKYRDQQSNPLDRAVFWVEYVLRHGGADSLSIASKNMSAYQTLHLDIWAVIVTVSLIFYLLIFKASCRTRQPVIKLKNS